MASAALTHWKEKVSRLQQSNKRAREKVGETMAEVFRTAEVGGSSYAFGYMRGRATDVNAWKIGSVPWELAAAAAMKALALMGVGKGMESHLNAFGDGALAAFSTIEGLRHGRKSKGGTGSLSLSGGEGLTPEDLAKISE